MKTQEEKLLAQVVGALNREAAASIAAGMIIASGRAHSIREAQALLRQVHFSLNAMPWSEEYTRWLRHRHRHQKRLHE